MWGEVLKKSSSIAPTLLSPGWVNGVSGLRVQAAGEALVRAGEQVVEGDVSGREAAGLGVLGREFSESASPPQATSRKGSRQVVRRVTPRWRGARKKAEVMSWAPRGATAFGGLDHLCLI